MASQIEDPLIEKLRETIRSWSGEVTGAHDLLSQQIGDARDQLHTLMNTISDQGPAGNPVTANDDVIPALKKRLERAEKKNDLFADEIFAQRKKNSIAANSLTAADEELEKMRAMNETAQIEQAELRKELAQLAAAAQKVGGIQETLGQGNEETQNLIAELYARLNDWEQVGNSQLLKINELEKALAQRNAPQPRQDELQAEINTLQNDLIHTQVALSRSQDEAKNLREHPELTIYPELESLRMELGEKVAALDALQDDLDLLRANKSGESLSDSPSRRELETVRHQLSNLQQNEIDLRSELTSLGHEYERQAISLTEATHELKSHWELQKESQEREQQLNIQLDKMHEQLKVKNQSLSMAEHELAQQRASIQDYASGNDETALDLQTYELFLDARENDLEENLNQIHLLEETALSLQSEIQTIRNEQQEQQGIHVSDEPLQNEIKSLRESLSEQSRLAEQRLNTIQEQSHLLQELQTHPLSHLQVASTENQDDSLTQALKEINQLRSALNKRDEVIAELKSFDAKDGHELEPLSFSAYDADGHRRSIGEILLNADIINQDQLDKALDEQKNSKQRRLGSILVEKGFIREEIVAQVVAGQLNLPFIRLKDCTVDAKAISLLNAHIATQHQCFPIKVDETELTIAMSNPLDLIAIEDLEFATQLKIKPVVATLEDIKQSVIKYFHIQFPEKSQAFDLKQKTSGQEKH
jgi:hypothetical protein